MIGLTKAQAQLLDFLKQRPRATYDEISDGLGIASRSLIQRRVTALIERGAIARHVWHGRRTYGVPVETAAGRFMFIPIPKTQAES